MVTIEEVQDTLSRTILPPPKHVYIAEKPIKVQRDGSFWIMGAQKRGQDMIVLSPLSTRENIIHETLHSLGFGEVAAQILGKLISLRISLFPNLFKKEVKYKLVEEDAAKRIGLEEKGSHYLLREKASYQVRHFVLEV
ncbi:MAG: hypothetical protein QXL22_01095 [Candidatus Nezhaarchaeales archaeon]